MKKIIVFSFLSMLLPIAALAAPTLTASETVSNVAGVSEVKAARTLTVASAVASSTAGTTAKSITVGTCVVSFATTTGAGTAYFGSTYTADEPNCTDNLALILLATTTNNTALTAAQLAQELRGLTNVSDTGHGTLLVAGSGSTVSFTTSGTEAAATNVTFSDGTGGSVTTAAPTTGVIPVTAVAQRVTFTPANSVSSETYTTSITINSTTYSYSNNGYTDSKVATDLAALMSGDAAVTCTASSAVITCVAKTAGTSFTYSAAVSLDTSTTPTASAPMSSSHRHSAINNFFALPPTASSVAVQVHTIGGLAFSRSMRAGSQGEDVKSLQMKLSSEGFFTVAPTGFFGPITEKAVKAYQSKYGIPSLGMVGPLTLKQLNK